MNLLGRTLGLWSLALACGSPDDHDRYLAAAASGDSAECLDIRRLDLRDECLAFAGRAAARAGDAAGARAACEQIVVGALWGDECWFEVSDGLRSEGADAIALCGRAGRFQTACLDHAGAREAEGILREQRVLGVQIVQVAAVLAPYMAPDRAARLAHDHVARWAAARLDKGVPLGALCPEPEEEICRDAVRRKAQKDGVPEGLPDLAGSAGSGAQP